MKHGKVIIVMDVHYEPKTWSLTEVRENLPFWADTAFNHAAALEDARIHNQGHVNYYLDNPTVYTSLEDFDADRRKHRDHFVTRHAHRWCSPVARRTERDAERHPVCGICDGCHKEFECPDSNLEWTCR